MAHKTYTTHSDSQTYALAAEFARTLRGGEVVFLLGDLGTGKTTFVRGVAQVLGFLEPVRSPSFTLVNRYPVECGNIKLILHVDLYRIDDQAQLVPLALEEELGRPDTVAFIEWPQNAKGLVAESSQEIVFSIADHARTISFLPPHASPLPRS